jgi:hypothetical protein
MPARSRKTKKTRKPTFVFKGTVQKLKSATMSAVPVDDRTIVVSVDQIISAPAILSKLAGQKITVRLSSRKKIKPGQEIIFHTVSWIYGDSIAVQSLSEEPVKSSHMTMLAAVSDPIDQHTQQVKQDRFDKADLVVSGKVVSVRLPSEPAGAKKTKGAGPSLVAQTTMRKPVSEHDPKWREAVVEVADVHKGSHGKKQVVVRFPASTDVMWYHAPKFQPGQQGFFMLQKSGPTTGKTKPGKAAGKVASSVAAMASEAEGAEAYTAMDPEDFQPLTESGGVKSILESTAEKEKP